MIYSQPVVPVVKSGEGEIVPVRSPVSERGALVGSNRQRGPTHTIKSRYVRESELPSRTCIDSMINEMRKK